MKKDVLFLILIALLFPGCLTNVEEDKPTQEFENVSFSDQIKPILDTKCVNCHGSNGGVNLSSYQNLMNSTGNKWGDEVVVPGSGSQSGLVDVLGNSPQNNIPRMPVGGPYLTANQIELIKTWIDEGALDN